MKNEQLERICDNCKYAYGYQLSPDSEWDIGCRKFDRTPAYITGKTCPKFHPVKDIKRIWANKEDGGYHG